MDSALVLLLLGTVNGELQILENRLKTAFEAKGRRYTTSKVIQRLVNIDLCILRDISLWVRQTVNPVHLL